MNRPDNFEKEEQDRRICLVIYQCLLQSNNNWDNTVLAQKQTKDQRNKTVSLETEPHTNKLHIWQVALLISSENVDNSINGVK